MVAENESRRVMVMEPRSDESWRGVVKESRNGETYPAYSQLVTAGPVFASVLSKEPIASPGLAPTQDAILQAATRAMQHSATMQHKAKTEVRTTALIGLKE
jgi:hypothetical protein